MKHGHKDHVTLNIPYGVARRVSQNSSEDTNFEEQSGVYSDNEAIAMKLLIMLLTNSGT